MNNLPNTKDKLHPTHIIEFPTGAKFRGNYNVMGMQDYGLYTYPDGSKYLGQFYNNRFHGKGTIELSPPHSICFSVLHWHGSLQEIYSMTFTDNLPVKFEWSDDDICLDDWDYCTPKDRRFAAEKLQPMEAVGPLKYLCGDGPNPPPLGRNIFDLGFAKYNRLGCITDVPSHMSEVEHCYVGCPEVRNWILHNCRHGELRGLQIDPEVSAKFAREIIQNNLENEKQLMGDLQKELATDDWQMSQLEAREMTLHLDSTSTTESSNLEENVKRIPSQRCTNCTSRKTHQSLKKPESPQQIKKKIQSDVCRLN